MNCHLRVCRVCVVTILHQFYQRLYDVRDELLAELEDDPGVDLEMQARLWFRHGGSSGYFLNTSTDSVRIVSAMLFLTAIRFERIGLVTSATGLQPLTLRKS